MPDSQGHPSVDEFDLSAVLAALADPNRRRVIVQLCHEPEGTEQFCTVFGLPWSASNRTHHFKVLRQAGLIWQRDVGNGRMTRLRRKEIEAVFPGLLEAITRAHRQDGANMSQATNS